MSENNDETELILQTSIELANIIDEIISEFEELVSQYSTNVAILRNYGRFVEMILFQEDVSESLYSQAMALEEEEENQRKKYHFKNNPNNDLGLNQVHETIRKNFTDDYFDDLDEAENFDAEDPNKSKPKEATMRSFIHKQPDFRWILVISLIIPSYVILGIAGGLIAEIIQSSSGRGSVNKGYASQVWMYFDMCDVANFPYYVLVSVS